MASSTDLRRHPPWSSDARAVLSWAAGGQVGSLIPDLHDRPASDTLRVALSVIPRGAGAAAASRLDAMVYAVRAMLDLPDVPELDKSRLIGGCVRLPLRVKVQLLSDEIAGLPDSVWGSTAGRIGVHRAADAVFLRGYAPAEGDHPVGDRAILADLPTVRGLIEQMIDAPRLRCVLARLPPGATIAPHRDDGAPYFAKTIRIHVPIESNDRTFMLCDGANYRMRPGEVWAIDNSAIHAVWNAHRTIARIHLICDYLPSPALLALLAAGTRGLGRAIPAVDAHWASYLEPPLTASA